MIDVIRQQFNSSMDKNQQLNVAREFLQILTLKILADKKYFKSLAFVGGTSLRILYNLRRFSEDLDFSLIEPEGYDFQQLVESLTKELALYNLPAETKVRSSSVVQSVMLKFSGLMKELDLSDLPDQKLSIKLEVDTNPPLGWQLDSTLINNYYLIKINHFDLPSLFAGKLHACFFRRFTKGRDFYDLIWYLSKKVKPNLVMLNNAIEQSQGKKSSITEQNFNDFLLTQIKDVDLSMARKDVERFVEDRQELDLLTTETLLGFF